MCWADCEQIANKENTRRTFSQYSANDIKMVLLGGVRGAVYQDGIVNDLYVVEALWPL